MRIIHFISVTLYLFLAAGDRFVLNDDGKVEISTSTSNEDSMAEVLAASAGFVEIEEATSTSVEKEKTRGLKDKKNNKRGKHKSKKKRRKARMKEENNIDTDNSKVHDKDIQKHDSFTVSKKDLKDPSSEVYRKVKTRFDYLNSIKNRKLHPAFKEEIVGMIFNSKGGYKEARKSIIDEIILKGIYSDNAAALFLQLAHTVRLSSFSPLQPYL